MYEVNWVYQAMARLANQSPVVCGDRYRCTGDVRAAISVRHRKPCSCAPVPESGIWWASPTKLAATYGAFALPSRLVVFRVLSVTHVNPYGEDT